MNQKEESPLFFGTASVWYLHFFEDCRARMKPRDSPIGPAISSEFVRCFIYPFSLLSRHQYAPINSISHPNAHSPRSYVFNSIPIH